MQNRIKWIDVSRGVAFLMVIYSHLDYCNPGIMKYFAPVFLTTFFFVSGYLSKEGHSFLYVLEQRTRTLLLPLLTMGGVMILMSNLLTFKTEVLSLKDAFAGLLLQNGENQLLWFIAALYIDSLGFYWIERYCNTEKKLATAALLLFAANEIYVYALHGPAIPWHIDSIGFACSYMALGKLYRWREQWFDTHITSRIQLLLFALYIAVMTILPYSFSFYGSKHLAGSDAFLITILGVIVCVYASKGVLKNNRLLQFIGANSLFYFAFHGKGYALLQALTAKALAMTGISHTIPLDTVLAFAIVLLDALLLIIPTLLVNRYCPYVLGKGFKLWKTRI